jgi:hypothetical protein
MTMVEAPEIRGTESTKTELRYARPWLYPLQLKAIFDPRDCNGALARYSLIEAELFPAPGLRESQKGCREERGIDAEKKCRGGCAHGALLPSPWPRQPRGPPAS